MKNIELKVLPIVYPDGKEDWIRYLDLIAVAAKQPGNGKNMDVDEMRKHLRILDALDKLPEKAQALVLEDADYGNLVDMVGALRFTFPSPAFVQFVDDIKTAK